MKLPGPEGQGLRRESESSRKTGIHILWPGNRVDLESLRRTMRLTKGVDPSTAKTQTRADRPGPGKASGQMRHAL